MGISTYITQEDKNELVTRAREHRKAKHLAKGVIAEDIGDSAFSEDYDFLDTAPTDGKAMCAVGCLATPLAPGKITVIPSDDVGYDKLAKEFGIPLELSRSADAIFETLPYKLAKYWPQRFAEALPVGYSYIDLPETEEFQEVIDIRENGTWDTADPAGEKISLKAANDLIHALQDAE